MMFESPVSFKVVEVQPEAVEDSEHEEEPEEDSDEEGGDA